MGRRPRAPGPVRGLPGGIRRAAVLGLALLLGGCELAEVDTTEARDLVVVEGLVRLGLPRAPTEVVDDPAREHLWAAVFVHRTVQGEQGENEPVPGARVELVLPGGERVLLDETSLFDCVETTPIRGDGTCYVLRVLEQDPSRGGIDAVGPGDRIELRVETPAGERLESTTFVPGDFSLEGIDHRARCALGVDTPLRLEWSPAAGAWAYVAESSLAGLRAALEPEGIPVEDDPLLLVGLSVGSDDTEIVFPAEFGVFERFDLDRALAVRLQRGLPESVGARIGINAVDRNYVNWARGGNFNPSGQVRIPSVLGDGTGFFGSSVTRWFDVVSTSAPEGGDLPSCTSR